MRAQITKSDLKKLAYWASFPCLLLLGVIIGIVVEKNRDPVKIQLRKFNQQLEANYVINRNDRSAD